MSLDKGPIFDDLTLWYLLPFIARFNIPLVSVQDSLTSSQKGKAVIERLEDGDKGKVGVSWQWQLTG